jgi:hypothetical protein
LPADVQKEFGRVVRCATAATEALGWIGNLAHWGQFMRTAMTYGGMPDKCADFADETQAHVKIRGAPVLWRQEGENLPIGPAVGVPLRFWMGDDETPGVVVTVKLPHRWHCYSWVHFEHHGGGCFETKAACQAAAKRHHNVIPCAVELGAAWCLKGTDRCFERPWDCQRETGASIAGPDPKCVKEP